MYEKYAFSLCNSVNGVFALNHVMFQGVYHIVLTKNMRNMFRIFTWNFIAFVGLTLKIKQGLPIRNHEWTCLLLFYSRTYSIKIISLFQMRIKKLWQSFTRYLWAGIESRGHCIAYAHKCYAWFSFQWDYICISCLLYTLYKDRIYIIIR